MGDEMHATAQRLSGLEAYARIVGASQELGRHPGVLFHRKATLTAGILCAAVEAAEEDRIDGLAEVIRKYLNSSGFTVRLPIARELLPSEPDPEDTPSS